jgi:hypothetical protein
MILFGLILILVGLSYVYGLFRLFVARRFLKYVFVTFVWATAGFCSVVYRQEIYLAQDFFAKIIEDVLLYLLDPLPIIFLLMVILPLVIAVLRYIYRDWQRERSNRKQQNAIGKSKE